jgi:hypothetical protein
MTLIKTIVLFTCLVCAVPVSAGQWSFIIEREYVPADISLAGSLWHGLRLGTVTGLSAGWVRYSGEHETPGIWSSTGWGALAGIGLTAAADLFDKRVTVNNILSDTGYGGRIGGSAGFLWGAVTALVSGESERIGDGTAWGFLGGATLGLLYSGYQAATGHYSETGEVPDGLTLPTTLPLPHSFNLSPSPSGTILLTYEKKF